MKHFLLNNGLQIPEVGFGTYKIDGDDQAADLVLKALNLGYRHIDTATVYGNEGGVGKALKQSGIPRNELFVTTKVWNDRRGYTGVLQSLEDSLLRLDLEYVDLLLLHWPANESQFPSNWKEINADSWRAMEELYHLGKVKAIGVSNFLDTHLEALLQTASVVPVINQLEFHPGYLVDETVQLCRAKDILVQAWSPLGRGRCLEDPTLTQIADLHAVSTAQVALKWCLQKGILPLPKSSDEGRMKQNLALYDFTLSEHEIAEINAISEDYFSGLDPRTVTF